MSKTLGRKRTRIPAQLTAGSGLRLVQAFREGDPAAAIPMDQVFLDASGDPKVLMHPSGNYWLRTVDRDTKVLANARLLVR
jgi:hypothetical protein